MFELRELYEEMILDHNRNPRNFQRRPTGANHQAHGNNPICGDEFTLYLTVHNGVIVETGFEGVGCAVSTASASLLTDIIKGKRVEEAEALFHTIQHMLTDKARNHEAEKQAGKLKVLAGVRDFPMRVKCAALPWHILHAAVNQESETVTTEAPPQSHECATDRG